MNSLACKHGKLKRSCQSCDDERYIEELEKSNQHLKQQLSELTDDLKFMAYVAEADKIPDSVGYKMMELLTKIKEMG